MISETDSSAGGDALLPSGHIFKRDGRELMYLPTEAHGGGGRACVEMTHYIPHGLIDPHPKNRTWCDEAALNELVESIHLHGQSTPGIVRPHPEKPGRFQLVAGWRRWQVCQRLDCSFTAMIRELDDAQALEQLYLENAARENLRPLDEADLVEGMLELRDAEGRRVFTLERVAKARYGSAKPGDVARVAKMHKLRLLPEVLREPVNQGLVGLGVAFLVARIADAGDREKAAADVLKDPHVYGEARPMTQRRAAEWIAERYQVNLKGWEHLETLGLLNAEQMAEMGFSGEPGQPGDGSCVNCPLLAKNNPLFEGALSSGSKKGSGESGIDPMTCTRASCHRDKLEALWQRVAWAFADANGLKPEAVMSLAESRQQGYNFVALDDKPTGWDLGCHDREVISKAPTWEKILKGSGAPLRVLPDDKSKPRLMCEKAVAIAVGVQRFPDLFRGRAEDENELDEEVLAELRAKREEGDELTADELTRLHELEKAEEEYRVSRLKENMLKAVNEEARIDSLKELLEKVTEKGPGLAGAHAMVMAVCRECNYDFLAFLTGREEAELQEEYDDEYDIEEGLKDYLKGRTVAEMIAVAAVAAVWGDVCYSGQDVAEDFQALCAAVGVDTRAIHARVKKAHELAFKDSEKARKAALKAEAGGKVKRKNSTDPVDVSADKEADKTAAADAIAGGAITHDYAGYASLDVLKADLLHAEELPASVLAEGSIFYQITASFMCTIGRQVMFAIHLVRVDGSQIAWGAEYRLGPAEGGCAPCAPQRVETRAQAVIAAVSQLRDKFTCTNVKKACKLDWQAALRMLDEIKDAAGAEEKLLEAQLAVSSAAGGRIDPFGDTRHLLDVLNSQGDLSNLVEDQPMELDAAEDEVGTEVGEPPSLFGLDAPVVATSHPVSLPGEFVGQIRDDVPKALIDLDRVDVEAAGEALRAGTGVMADFIGIKPHKQKESERFKRWDALRAKILRKAGLKK